MKPALIFMAAVLLMVPLLAAQQPPACQATAPSSTVPAVPLSLSEVNVMTDCGGVAGDGTTDDWLAIQTCINNNPGKHIVLPKTNFYPANPGTTVDYFSSRTLTLCGDSQWFSGETAGRSTGATLINFPQGSSGFAVFAPTSVCATFGSTAPLAITISVEIYGSFDSAIALTATAPQGVSVMLTPTSIPAPGSGVSTLTVTNGSTLPIGAYPITVTGVGGVEWETAALTLNVMSSCTPASSAPPATVPVAQGSSGTAGPPVTGPGIYIPLSCRACKVSDLSLYAGPLTALAPVNGCWRSGDLTTFDPPLYIANYCATGNTCLHSSTETTAYTGWGPDGVVVAGGEATVERVIVECFERHGFAILGDGSTEASSAASPEAANLWSMTDDVAIGNRGWGLVVLGGDANDGSSLRMVTENNQLGAIFDYSEEGNSYYDSESTLDAEYGGVTAIASLTMSSITSVFLNSGLNLCTMTPSGSLPAFHSWITVLAPLPSANGVGGTYRIEQGNPSAGTVTYYCPPNTPLGTSTAPFRAATASEVLAPALTGTPAPTPTGIVGYAAPNNIANSTVPNEDETGMLIGAFTAAAPYVVWFNAYCENGLSVMPPNYGDATGLVFGSRLPF